MEDTGFEANSGKAAEKQPLVDWQAVLPFWERTAQPRDPDTPWKSLKNSSHRVTFTEIQALCKMLYGSHLHNKPLKEALSVFYR